MLSNHLQNYLYHHDIEDGDVVVINAKRGFDPFRHFAAYVGNGQFIANLPPGIQVIEGAEIWDYFDDYSLLEVRKFQGTMHERFLAVNRAWELYNSGEYDDNYSYVRNNCEHFGNYVQDGQRYSKQVQLVSGGAVVAGALMMTSKNENVQLLGLLAVIFGGAALIGEASNNDINYNRLPAPQYLPQKRIG